MIGLFDEELSTLCNNFCSVYLRMLIQLAAITTSKHVKLRSET